MGIKTERGYTEHEHLDEIGVIHMNGCVYDPLMGRFMSADPNVFHPENMKDFNRYSYVWNNLLKMFDPSGFSAYIDSLGGGYGSRNSVTDRRGVGGIASGSTGWQSGGNTMSNVSSNLSANAFGFQQDGNFKSFTGGTNEINTGGPESSIKVGGILGGDPIVEFGVKGGLIGSYQRSIEVTPSEGLKSKTTMSATYSLGAIINANAESSLISFSYNPSAPVAIPSTEEREIKVFHLEVKEYTVVGISLSATVGSEGLKVDVRAGVGLGGFIVLDLMKSRRAKRLILPKR